MPLDKRHFSPSKSEREIHVNDYYHPIYKTGGNNIKEYKRIEDLLDEATCDFINGLSKSDILIKFEKGLYDNQKKGVGHNIALQYYRAILSRLEIDEPNKDEAKYAFYSMYLNLYREAMEAGNRMEAKQILDSMVKLTGLDKQTPQTAIQVNGGDKVEVKFGFEKDD